MAAAPAKFNFDLDLGHPRERNSMVSESAMATLVTDARIAGRAEGFAEGERSAMANAARQLAEAANGLADRVATLSASLEDAKKATLADAVELAAGIARKLAGALVEREPAAEIEMLIAECLASLDGVPHLVIRCHPDLADAVREIATGRMATSGFTGRLVVMGDPDQALGDGRIEWVDGGIVRDMAAISAEIDNRIAAYLAARGASRPEETEP
jgi:flagellar assembly protein FliH